MWVHINLLTLRATYREKSIDELNDFNSIEPKSQY